MTQVATQWGRPTVHARGRAVPSGRRLRRIGVLLLAPVVAASVYAATRSTPDDPPPTLACRVETCAGYPALAGGLVGRDEVAARAARWLGNTGIRYSMAAGHAGAGGWGWYRRDCSGFVSMALRLPDDDGGPTTVGLADLVTPIAAADLRPYDLIGRLGPGSEGEHGHVQLFLGWADAAHTRVRVAEQGGLTTPDPWPHRTTYAWPERMDDGTVLQAYRYRDMRGD